MTHFSGDLGGLNYMIPLQWLSMFPVNIKPRIKDYQGLCNKGLGQSFETSIYVQNSVTCTRTENKGVKNNRKELISNIPSNKAQTCWFWQPGKMIFEDKRKIILDIKDDY